MRKRLFVLLILITVLFSSCGVVYQEKEDSTNVKCELLEVHFIDVGQGDSILIKGNNTTMLIDAGTLENGVKIADYLNENGIEELDYFIGTHPHDDHLGGAAIVIRRLNPKYVFLNGEVSTSYFYEKLLDVLIEKEIRASIPETGCVYREEDFEFKFISPTIDFNDTNDNSLVLMIKHQNVKMLFMADAEKSVEDVLLKNEADLSADILKAGHHGSRNASSYEFLKKVKPIAAVIQSETGNSYGHPHEETIERLTACGANIYRCDESGNIVIKSDGNKIYYNDSEINRKEVIDNTVYIANKKSGKFHRDTCRNLPDKKNSVVLKTREEAILRGFSPCGSCNP